MKVLSLFSGVGTTELAMKYFGWKTVAFCEIDTFCRLVLEKRFPGIKIFDDITKMGGEEVGTADLVCGGFPCQDLSFAGAQRGLVDADGNQTRSGLWFEMLRIIRAVKPPFVLVENVRGAVRIALDTVTTNLRDANYSVASLVFPACAIGAPHRRERLFILGVRNDVANRFEERQQGGGIPGIHVETGAQSTDEQFARRGACLWATPTVHGNYNRRGASSKSGDGLATQVVGNNWPTPRCGNLCGGSGSRHMMEQAMGREEARKYASTGGGQLNPDWVECLQGLPIGWTDLDCDSPRPWPGWPMGMPDRQWMTPSSAPCGSTSRTSGRPLEKSTHLNSQIHTVTVFDQHEYEPPRMRVGIKDRARRLKALGNCNPPQQYMPALMAIETMRRALDEGMAEKAQD